MLQQTFSASDILTVLFLAFIEILLSADNAIILGTITHHLPYIDRKKALYIGSFSAIILRALGIVSIAFFIHFFWIQLIGALYLLYLSAHHFCTKKNANASYCEHHQSFWKTVFQIELFDILFALDSMIAGIAFIGPSPVKHTLHPKIWVVYVGGMIGLFGMRYAAHFFSTLIDYFPRLIHISYIIIGWIGIKLGLNSLSLTFPYSHVLFWIGLIVLLLLGFSKSTGKK